MTDGDEETQALLPGSDSTQSAPVKIQGPEDDSADVAWRVTGACLGFLASSYNAFAAVLVASMMRNLYGDLVFDDSARRLMWGLQMAGTVAGMLGFGLACDLLGPLGHRWASVLSAGLMTTGALAGSLASSSGGAANLPWQFALCRFVMGLGAGGEYPLAVAATAGATRGRQSRGQLLAVLASMYGVGMLLLGAVCLGTFSLRLSSETSWRLVLAFGALPAWEAAFLRFRMCESNAEPPPRVRALDAIFGHSHRGSTAFGSGRSYRRLIDAVETFWQQLLGNMAAWLLTNASLHSVGSLRGHVLGVDLRYSLLNAAEQAQADAKFLVVSGVLASTGFAAAILIVNRGGRTMLQLWGFLGTAAALFAAAFAAGHRSPPAHWGLLPCLGAALLLQCLGPRATLVVAPVEAFPAWARGTFVALCAACGELGALLGDWIDSRSETGGATPTVLMHCACLALAGAAASYLLTPRYASDPCLLESPRLSAVVSLDLYGQRARCDFQTGW